MILRIILWFNRLWWRYRDACQPHIELSGRSWHVTRGGDE